MKHKMIYKILKTLISFTVIMSVISFVVNGKTIQIPKNFDIPDPNREILDEIITTNGRDNGSHTIIKTSPIIANDRQLKDQYNTINIGYDEYQGGPNRRPYNPYDNYYQQPQPGPPYYPPYYPPPPTTTTTTTAKPKGPPQPIGYMLIDTYHSPQGYSYSRPIAYFHTK